MDSYIDISFHVVFSLVTGYITWKFFAPGDKKSLAFSLISAFLGGVLIDLDHFIDNFLAFGLNFNYDYFMKGEYFLRSGKTYVFFHGFEYIVFFGITAILTNSKKWKISIST